jgi:hypothetical protein
MAAPLNPKTRPVRPRKRPVTGTVRIAKLEVELEGDSAEVSEKVVALFDALKDALSPKGRK